MTINNPAHPGHTNHLISTNGWKAGRVWHHPEPMLESVRHELITVAQSFRKERCGVIDSEWNVWNINNSHEEPFRNFYISEEDSEEIFRTIYEKRENQVIAVWHTHPNDVPWPSPRDIRGWPNPKLGWRYFIATNDDVFEWELVQE